MKVLEIWTDGSCWPNPGNGAWAFILAKNIEGERTVIHEASGMEQNVTNNRMEYLGLIEAFKYYGNNDLGFKPDEIRCFSDSNLLVQTINSWMDRWKANGWKRRVGRQLKPVANLDLVMQLDLLRRFKFKIEWVKGHANIPLNERCDELCRAEFSKRGLKSFEELRDSGKLFSKGGTSCQATR